MDGSVVVPLHALPRDLKSQLRDDLHRVAMSPPRRNLITIYCERSFYVLDGFFYRFCCVPSDRLFSELRPRSASTRSVHCQSFARGP